MIELEITCPQCGRIAQGGQICVATESDLGITRLKKEIEKLNRGRIVQFNGGNIDIYCGKECAK